MSESTRYWSDQKRDEFTAHVNALIPSGYAKSQFEALGLAREDSWYKNKGLAMYRLPYNLLNTVGSPESEAQMFLQRCRSYAAMEKLAEDRGD